MRNFLWVILLLVGISFYGFQKSKTSLVIGWYNVENLFDTINDPNTNDDDFTPTGKYSWNSKKYRIKLNNLANAIATLIDDSNPVVIGLCEVENKHVLEDLVKTKRLKPYNLSLIHKDSPDERGIDVAALYNPKTLKLRETQFLKVNLPDEKDHTRDILFIDGLLLNERFYFIFNHWPSRREGETASEPKRMAAAQVVFDKCTSVLSVDSGANLVIAGDFNDEPTNKSLLLLESVKAKNTSIINLSKALAAKGKGTHSFKNEWNMLDQIMVSSSLSQSDQFVCPTDATIHQPDWLLFKHKDGSVSPNKSYSGTRFHASGYSDHLPVYIKLELKAKK